MKKLFILSLLMFFSFVLVAQERKISNYEKYRIEKDNERLGHVDEEIFDVVEDMPRFGGEKAESFREWIAENIQYPEYAINNEHTG